MSWVGTRKNYGEVRYTALVLMGTRLYCIAYTLHGNELRAISLRKANQREVTRYVADN